MKLTQQAIKDLCVFCAVSNVYSHNIRYERAHLHHNPLSWWREDASYLLSIRSPENAHGEYYLALSPNNVSHPDDADWWFCFLQDGQWGSKFMHLRHVATVHDIAAIAWALARLRVFANAAEMLQYAQTLDPEARL